MENESSRQFIEEHRHKSEAELRLILSKKKELDADYLIHQIIGLQKAAGKFPGLLALEDYEFPSPRAMEQASSERAAQFKAGLFEGNKMADLSGGMGMDSWYFADHFKQVDHVERNAELAKTSQKNFARYKRNIRLFIDSAESFLYKTAEQYELIYLDPDRRVGKSRAFKLEDCEPQLKEILPSIWKLSPRCLVKLSPMLDIQQALTELADVKQVYVYSLKNECKELLFLLEENFQGEAEIICVNENAQDKEVFSFLFTEERALPMDTGSIGKYLLDPNASIRKAGAFKLLGHRHAIKKVATNTQLYSSDEVLADFPGRQFELLEELQLKKGDFKLANVICKNYPLKTEAFKKKYGIKDGSDDFIIALSDAQNKKRIFHAKLALL